MNLISTGLVLILSSVISVHCWLPRMFNGRPRDGLIPPPPQSEGIKYPDEKFYEFQYVNHFDGSDYRYWKQRYFVNDTFQSGADGPVFLVLGGEAELNPIWAVEGAWIQYAQQHRAVLILLEHRYYGKSQPVKDLSASNLQYLSSRQALADAAQFITYYKWWNHINDTSKVIVFGASYSGSLAAWFRSQYPNLVHGAIASSAPLEAGMDFYDYFVAVTRALDTTGTKCTSEIRKATQTMFQWWGQPKKRVEMQEIFGLCDKIDSSLILDFSVFFYNLAVNFAEVVQYNRDNRAYLGVSGTNITIETVCDIMTDDSRGDSVHRYADVNALMLDAHKEHCLNLRYTKLVQSLNYTELDNGTSNNGGRQWLYQTCAEFGWFHTSSSPKQPFGDFIMFPFNFTTDQCIDLFYEGEGKGLFGVEEVTDNAAGTNRYYGGLNIPISNSVFVDHEMDPWRNVTATQHLPKSRNTEILHVKGTAHIADIYPASDQDPPQLAQARATISQIIGKWLAETK